jgi:phosphoglycolate phosphatase
MHPTPAVLMIFDFDNTLIDSRINFSELRATLIDTLEAAAPQRSARAELMRLPIHALVERGQVLEDLAARGYRLALLTNNARPATQRMLDALALAPLLPLVVTRDDVPRLKPDPSGIRFILRRLGPIGAAYLVGDSWIDGQAAAAAGVRFIGFGPRREEVTARGVTAWAWVTDLRGLLDLTLDP